MTIQTMFDQPAPAHSMLQTRLEDTPLDPVKGRQREFRVIFALTVAVLVLVFAVARLGTLLRPATASRRSIVQEALATARSALPFAYRH